MQALIVIASLVLATLLTLISEGNVAIPVGEWFPLDEILTGAGVPLIDRSTNAYHLWRIDPLVRIVSWLLPGTAGYSSISVALLTMLGFTLSALLLLESKRGERLNAITSVGLGVCALLIFTGYSIPSLAALVWVPPTIIAFRAVIYSLGPAPLVLSLVAALLLVVASRQLSFISMTVALLFAVLIPSANRRRMLSPEGIIAALLIAYLPVMVGWCCYQSPDFPDYPPDVRVVPDDTVAGTVSPQTTARPPLQVIDREWVRVKYAPYALVFVLISIGALILDWTRGGSGRAGRSLWIPTSLFLSIALANTLPESLALITPLPSLSRLIPGLFFFELSTSVFALGLLSLVIACHLRALSVYLGLSLLTVQLLVVQPLDIEYGGRIKPAVLQRETKFSALNGVSDLRGRYPKYDLTPIIFSPSQLLIATLGPQILEHQALLSRLEFSTVESLQGVVFANERNRGDLLQRVSDLDPDTRWHSAAGGQNGDEYIYLQLPTSVSIRALRLSPGKFFTDFPRGLRVSIPANCDELVEGITPKTVEKQTIFETNSWQGGVGFSPDGYPFYFHESRVDVIFENPAQGACLLIEQTQISPYDWSIAELGIAFDSNRLTVDETSS